MTEESTAQKSTEQRRAERLIKDISHLKPETVQALATAGYSSMQDLLKASAERIAQEAKVAVDKVKELQQDAQSFVKRVALEVKTTEGRKKLVEEGKDTAIKTAQNVEASARDLLAKAQTDGEAAISKALDLKEKAPTMIHDARIKAEAALKDAEAKVKDIAGKAPESVKEARAKATAAVKEAQSKVQELARKTEEFAKTEIQKVKAANEGSISRLKAKFQRKN
jgi:ElaB/YqjD/DUF883 family membrane-anchored ribosome-binding protein